MSMNTIDIVFDGPPGPEAGRFVEVENSTGAGIKVGEWIKRKDGFWALRIPDHRALTRERDELRRMYFSSAAADQADVLIAKAEAFDALAALFESHSVKRADVRSVNGVQYLVLALADGSIGIWLNFSDPKEVKEAAER